MAGAKSLLGCYIPDAEPRLVPDNALIHESVLKRMETRPDYRPVNLPPRFDTVAMPTGPSEPA
jgi:hypothetical protein